MEAAVVAGTAVGGPVGQLVAESFAHVGVRPASISSPCNTGYLGQLEGQRLAVV